MSALAHLTAPDQVGAAEAPLLRLAIREGLDCYVGESTGVAQLVADMTGDTIRPPFRIAGFLDDEFRTFVAILHSAKVGEARRLELSIEHHGLPLSRTILTILAIAAFDEFGAAEMVTRVRSLDLDRRAALQRLGFRMTGRESRHDGQVLVLTLTPATLPASYRRRVRRHSH